MTVMLKQERGLVTNKDEEMVREWKWPWDGTLDQPATGQVNKYITVRIAACFVISFFYKYQHAGADCSGPCLIFKTNKDRSGGKTEQLYERTRPKVCLVLRSLAAAAQGTPDTLGYKLGVKELLEAGECFLVFTPVTQL
ncbi:hypothetical protein BTVI_52274 [Pitangus sulphuratus]|nr:hypothetical protein BTVI_52274 [Pitangus sulphuratus]